MSRMEPVAWAYQVRQEFGRMWETRVVTKHRPPEQDAHTEQTWFRVAPLYTADQIREMVEEVRARQGPKPGLNKDDWKRYAWIGAIGALDAILARLEGK